jgi:hypothetical protein
MTQCSRRALIRGAALLPLATAVDGLLDAAGTKSGYFPRQGTYDHHTLSYDLHLAYDPASGTLDGRAHINAVADRPLGQVELDLAHHLTIRYAAGGSVPAGEGTHEVVEDVDGLLILSLRSHTVLEQFAASAGAYARECLVDDPFFEPWMEAGPAKMTIVRNGTVVHGSH